MEGAVAQEAPTQPQVLNAPAEPNVAEGAIGERTVTSQPNQIELDHTIGYSGSMVGCVQIFPNGTDYMMVAGSSIVSRRFDQLHD